MPVKPKNLQKQKYPKDILTGETFIYHVEPPKSDNPQFIINTDTFKMYSQTGKAYIIDGAEIEEIEYGAFNDVISKIAGLSDTAVADKIKTLFRTGAIKRVESLYRPKGRHYHRPKNSTNKNHLI